MGLTLEVILFALLVLVLNVMDSVTTSLCFRQYPDKELKGEGNPIMRWLMLKNKALSEVFKQGFILGFVVWWLLGNQLETLRLATIMFGLVVLNNSYIVVSRAIVKRETVTPLKKIRMLFHVPDKYSYMLALTIILWISIMIYWLVWG